MYLNVFVHSMHKNAVKCFNAYAAQIWGMALEILSRIYMNVSHQDSQNLTP